MPWGQSLSSLSCVALALTASAVAFASVGSATSSGASRVAEFLTTKDLKTTLARQPDLHLDASTPAAAEDITVDPRQMGQELTAGFGVAMTDSSAKLLRDELSAAASQDAMNTLFSSLYGLGLTFLRIPIAGSDYVVGKPYSYDDQPPGGSDPTLAQFSITYDRPYVLPAIREALALAGGRMTVMANPWTPPAWMKTDDTLITTTGPAGQLEPRYYGAYADYLVKFLQAYRDAGVNVDYLGVQNEPLTPLLFVAGIPESYLDGPSEGRLIASYVAPALRAAGLKPGILAYDDGYERSETFIPGVMALAAGDVAGFAYHCYFSDPMSIGVESALYPGKAALETECSSKLSDIDPQQMAIRNLRAGAQGIQLWNAALDQHGGPKIGNGCKGITGPYAGIDCIAPITVNTDTHTFSLTGDYWALAHFSRFIRPGAHRIASTTPSDCRTTPASGWNCGLEDVAFQNTDGSRVLVATANDGQAHTFSVTVDGRRFTATIPDGGTETFVWNDTGSPPSTPVTPSTPGAACPKSRVLKFGIHANNGRVTRVDVFVGKRRVKVVRGHSVRSVSIPRPGQRNYVVRIVDYTVNGTRVISTRIYRNCARRAPHIHARHPSRNRR